MKKFVLTSALVLALSPAALADSLPVADISIDHPYAYATTAPQTNGAVFFQAVNHGTTADRLIGASAAEVAESTELHTHIMDGDTMMMREIEFYDLPAGETTVLEPMGHHIMLMGLKAPLEAGQTFSVHLDFEQAPDRDITVEIVPPGTLPEGAPARHNDRAEHPDSSE